MSGGFSRAHLSVPALVLCCLLLAQTAWAAFMIPGSPIRPKDFTLLKRDGVYHLFYIRNNTSLPASQSERDFGHAVSVDLYHWTQLPPVMRVDTLGWDNEHVWAPHIVERDIRGIVFLGGDLHLSCIVSMELQLPGFAPVRATQVVASGLYAPLAVANVGKRSIDWDREQTLDLEGCRVVSRPTLLTQSTSHFVRVSAVRESAGAGWTLRAEAYDHTAALLRSVEQEI